MTAYRWDPADPDGAQEIAAVLLQAGAGFGWPEHMGAAAPLEIWFLGRHMAANPGDWIIRDERGVDVLDETAFKALATVPGGGKARP